MKKDLLQNMFDIIGGSSVPTDLLLVINLMILLFHFPAIQISFKKITIFRE